MRKGSLKITLFHVKIDNALHGKELVTGAAGIFRGADGEHRFIRHCRGTVPGGVCAGTRASGTGNQKVGEGGTDHGGGFNSGGAGLLHLAVAALHGGLDGLTVNAAGGLPPAAAFCPG